MTRAALDDLQAPLELTLFITPAAEMPASAPEETEGDDMSSAPEIAVGAGLKLNAAAP